MRLPRLRFTVRRLMVAVAVVCLAARAAETAAERYRKRAKEEEFLELNFGLDCRGFSPTLGPAEFERRRKRLDFHAAMRRKYQWAARFPFLPVAPDPPEPE